MYSRNNNLVFAGLPLHNEVEFVQGFKGIPKDSYHVHSGQGGIKHNIQNDRDGLNDFNNYIYHNKNYDDDEDFVQGHEVIGAFVQRKKNMGFRQHYWHCQKCGQPHTHDPQYGCNTPDALGKLPLNWLLRKQLENQRKGKKVLSYETGIAPYGVASLGGLAHGIMPNRKFRYPVYK